MLILLVIYFFTFLEVFRLQKHAASGKKNVSSRDGDGTKDVNIPKEALNELDGSLAEKRHVGSEQVGV